MFKQQILFQILVFAGEKLPTALRPDMKRAAYVHTLHVGIFTLKTLSSINIIKYTQST